jgi:hypothetical protein
VPVQVANDSLSNVKYKALYDYNFTSVATWPAFNGWTRATAQGFSISLSDIEEGL